MAVHVLGLNVVSIEKRSSIGFLRAAMERHRRGTLILPVEAGTATNLPGIHISEHVACADGGGWFTERFEPRHDSFPAQIALTSGTTGKPKPIVLSHRALGDVTVRLIDVMNLDDTIREYVGVPVTYSFGFGRIRAVAAVGGASFLPERGFRVDQLAAMLQSGDVNAFSAVPTLLRVVLDQRQRLKQAGRALRWLEIGSQAMTRAEKEAVRELFPNARIVQHYGLTEASRSTFLDISAESGRALDSVGQPNGTVKIAITGQGLIAIRGRHVADGIVTADGIQAITDDNGWLVTGDLGHRDNALLCFDGRADDLINVGGIKVASEIFEEKLLARLGPRFALAVAPGRDRLRGQIAVVAHEPLDDPAALAVLRSEVAHAAAELNITDAFALMPVQVIPRTETNKIRRSEIAGQFNAVHDETPAKPVETSAQAATASLGAIADLFVSVFGEAARDRNTSFHSLGGDSLQYVTMGLGLEQHLPKLPDDWDRTSIADLTALASGSSGVIAAFVAVFGEAARNEGASFQSLGGDSLHYVMLQADLERYLPAVPDDWDTNSIGALAALASQSRAGATGVDDARPAAKKRQAPGNLDTVRGLACILVVALHVVGVAPDEGLKIPAGSAWHRVMDALDLIRLPLFTALAGYLYGAMPATRDGFSAYMRRKAGQLLLPLLFATLVFWALRQAVNGENERSLFWAYVYGYQHLWYIDALLLMFAFVGLVDTRAKPTWVTWTAIVALVLVSSKLLPHVPVLHLNNAIFLLPFFIFGILLYRVPALFESRALLAFSAIALPAIIALQQGFAQDYLALNRFGLLEWAGGAASVIALLHLLPKSVWIERIAAYSFTIYLWHPAANGVVRNMLWALGVHSTGFLFIIGLGAGVLIPVLMHIVLLRFPKIISAPIIGR